MDAIPSSTWFTVPPHWGWLIVIYFFLGGLSGGCYLFAALIDLLGRREDRPLARTGYYVAFLCLVVSGVLLIIDLARPSRFWHLLLEDHTWQPMFKYWSPMSIGSWMLLVFGIFAFLSVLGALSEAGRLAWPAARRLRAPGTLGAAIAIVGSLLGLYVAGYTGVLIAVTNRPIWADTPLLGMLLVVSGASISAALLILLAPRVRSTALGLTALERTDAWLVALEFLVLVAVVISLGAAARAWLSGWGVLLLLGVVGLGMALPLA
ncbi:MAG: NrfD/PsrC family molybdoenzyme membrane anchor subunit, partial [Rhodospirillaceae bacterium]